MSTIESAVTGPAPTAPPGARSFSADRVVVLTADDATVHAGVGGEVLAHYVPAGGPLPAEVAALEIYTADGKRLTIRAGADGGAELVESGETADPPGLVVDRITLCLARAQVALGRDPGSDPEGLIGRVPVLQGPLHVVVPALAAWFRALPRHGAPAPPNDGGPVHDWLHSVGLAHLF